MLIKQAKFFYTFVFGFISGMGARCIRGEEPFFLVFYIFISACLVSVCGLLVHWFGNNKKLFWFFVFMLGVIMGVWRFEAEVLVQAENMPANGKRATLEGIVDSEVTTSSKYQKFAVDRITIDGQARAGKVLVYAHVYPEIGYGQVIAADCELQIPETVDDFDYRAYLARQGIYRICFYPALKIIEETGSGPMAAVYKLKIHLGHAIQRGLKEPAAGIIRATLLGENSAFDRQTSEAFSRSGLSHVISISGMHITIMGGVLFWLIIQAGLGRTSNVFLSAFVLFFYLVLIGFLVSAVRAYAMLLIVSLALISGRLVKPILALVLAAFLLLLFSPRSILDIGFQLSFLALLGIIEIYPVIDRLAVIEKYPRLRPISTVVAVTIAAQLTTWPVLAYNFGIVSLIAPLSNLLVVWLSPAIIILGWAGLSFSLLLPSLAVWWFLPIQFLLDYTVGVAEISSRLPYSVWSVGQTGLWIIMLYYIMLALIIYKQKNRINLFLI